MRTSERGDTIIEVIMAFAVFALLAVGTIALMQRGTATAQAALESTQTRRMIDGQTEALRYMRELYVSNPEATGAGAVIKDIITNRLKDQPSTFGDSNCTNALPNGAFAINPETRTIIEAKPMTETGAPAYPQLVTVAGVTTAYGVWIEPIEGQSFVGSDLPGYVDFHVRACWFGPGGSIPITTGTIQRLYISGTEAAATP